jgi:hypothetical protein
VPTAFKDHPDPWGAWLADHFGDGRQPSGEYELDDLEVCGPNLSREAKADAIPMRTARAEE